MPPPDTQLGAAEKGLSSSPDNKEIAPIKVQKVDSLEDSSPISGRLKPSNAKLQSFDGLP